MNSGPQILEGCTGCAICVDMCPGDVLALDEEKCLAYVAYPDECWYCGVCRIECPGEAVTYEFPIAMIAV